MYKVLLVDDEFIILDGIASVMDWEACGTVLAGTAQNGVEALEMVKRDPPDIIISDIRMPGLDGLQLIAAVAELYPDTQFIMLTGFSEFDYAKTAMQYGVKHYLLKPCSEESLAESLAELVQERKERDEHRQFVQSIKYGLERVLPHAKEQFLTEFVTNKTYGVREWTYFGELFGLQFQSQRVRLLLFAVEGDHEYEHLFAVKNIAEDMIRHRMLSSTVGSHVLILMEDALKEEELFERIGGIRDAFRKYYRFDLTAALSDPGELTQVRRMYNRTLHCLNHRFYLGEGSLITERDIAERGKAEAEADKQSGQPFEYDEKRFAIPIQAGNWEEAERELARLFRQLSDARLSIAETKSYLVQMFMEVVRLCDPAPMKDAMDQMTRELETGTLQSFQQFVLAVAKQAALERFERHRRKHSQIVEQVKSIVERRYREESLTLQTIAGEMYMNPDYIGKMFKKETGEKFTQYIIGFRIQKALELIERGGYSIASLAEETGFGDNASYFSKVFKKHTGFSPSEYKKSQ